VTGDETEKAAGPEIPKTKVGRWEMAETAKAKFQGLPPSPRLWWTRKAVDICDYGLRIANMLFEKAFAYFVYFAVSIRVHLWRAA